MQKSSRGNAKNSRKPRHNSNSLNKSPPPQSIITQVTSSKKKDSLYFQGKILKPYSFTPNKNLMKAPPARKLLPAQEKKFENKKTLVLDLDETLVHSSFMPFEHSDIVLKVMFDGALYSIHVLVRPDVDFFLKEVGKLFEVVLFTASLSKYASPLMDIIDPEKCCAYRLYREHCTQVNGLYVKDLKKLNRNLKDVIIVDNSPISFAFTPENGIPVKSWISDKKDQELNKLLPFLSFLAGVDDVRDYIPKVIKNDEISFKEIAKVIENEKKKKEEKQPSSGPNVVLVKNNANANTNQGKETELVIKEIKMFQNNFENNSKNEMKGSVDIFLNSISKTSNNTYNNSNNTTKAKENVTFFGDNDFVGKDTERRNKKMEKSKNIFRIKSNQNSNNEKSSFLDTKKSIPSSNSQLILPFSSSSTKNQTANIIDLTKSSSLSNLYPVKINDTKNSKGGATAKEKQCFPSLSNNADNLSSTPSLTQRFKIASKYPQRLKLETTGIKMTGKLLNSSSNKQLFNNLNQIAMSRSKSFGKFYEKPQTAKKSYRFVSGLKNYPKLSTPTSKVILNLTQRVPSTTKNSSNYRSTKILFPKKY